MSTLYLPFMQNLAGYLQSKRDALGLSHADIARRMVASGITATRASVSRWMSGHHAPNAAKLGGLLAALDVPKAEHWQALMYATAEPNESPTP